MNGKLPLILGVLLLIFAYWQFKTGSKSNADSKEPTRNERLGRYSYWIYAGNPSNEELKNRKQMADNLAPFFMFLIGIVLIVIGLIKL